MRPLRCWWPELIAGFGITLGVGLMLVGQGLPSFTDEERAMIAFGRACDDNGPIDGWWRSVDAFRTYRDPLLNAGAGLLLAGVTAAFLRVAMLLPPARGWPRFRTPQATWMFFAIGSGTIALALGASTASLEVDQERFMFAACADSIAIPIGGLIMLSMPMGGILLLVGIIVSRWFGALPVGLDHWDASRSARSWIVSVIFGVPLVALVVGTPALLLSSSAFLMPSFLLTMYLLASTRAALLAPPRQRVAKA